ncbi:MAG: SixA phosphatase family protein [Pyrinomonadaceae bacterium]
MKSLFILRHAKSSWKDSALQDFDRPLNARGRRAAEVVGRFIRQQKIALDLILSSPAVRARETIEIVIKTAKLTTELRYDQRIYEAGPLRLLEVISQIEEDKSNVLLVGHNPGLEELLQILTDKAERMNTGTLAKITFETTKWRKTLEKKGSLEWVVKPKELEKE